MAKKSEVVLPEGPVIISRTDAIGDVVLTLPLAGYIKSLYPEKQIIFLGRSYTRPVVNCCSHIDIFVNYDDFTSKSEEENTEFLAALKATVILMVFPDKNIVRMAKKAGIPYRVGTSHRWFHWLYANCRPSFTRKNSSLHEAQLNFQLLKAFGTVPVLETDQLFQYTGFDKKYVLPQKLQDLLDVNTFNLIIHPRSKGSSREWGISNFLSLIRLLPNDRFSIFVTGTKQEAETMPELLGQLPASAVDLTGKLSLEEFIAFIQSCDGIVACSTGPLHIGAASGIHAIGLYPPMRPLHPGRWKPIGPNTKVFCLPDECNDCRRGGACPCIEQISPSDIAAYLSELTKIKHN